MIGSVPRPIASASADLRAEVLSVSEAEAERAAWTMLADTAVEPNPFFRPEFLLPYLREIALKGVAIVAVRKADGSFAALAPLGRRRLGLLVSGVHTWSHPFAPLGVPLLAADIAEPAACALLRHACDYFGGLIAVPELHLDGPAGSAMRSAAARSGLVLATAAHHERPALMCGRTETILAQVSSSRRRKARKYRRRLEASGRLAFTRHEGERVKDAFEVFLDVERSGWKGRSGTALASEPHRVAFARDAVTRLAVSGRAIVDILTLDDKAVAGLVCLRDRERAYAWKIAFDEDHARNSPGMQVMLEASELFVASSDLAMVDSLSAPGPGLLADLWNERVALATLLMAGRRFPLVRLALARADIAAASRLRSLFGRDARDRLLHRR